MKPVSFLVFAALAPLALTHAPARADDVADDGDDTTTVVTTAAPPSAATTPSFSQGLLFPHSILDLALARAVDKNGTVDYVALKADKDLAQYVLATASADLSAFPTWPIEPDPKDPKAKDAKPKIDRSAELVFWINAYNAHVLKTLSDAYPIDSSGDIKDFDTAKTHRIAGTDYSLAEVRAKIAGFDPRALFVLTDGSAGGPLLAGQAYRIRNLDVILNAAVAAYISDDRNVEVLRIANKVTLSDFFADANAAFTPLGERKKMAGVRHLLSSYSDKRGQRSYLNTNDYQIVFKPRDHKLNMKPKQ